MIRPFALGGFRSYANGPHYVPVHPRLNLVAGPNNSGKSNLLAFLFEGHYAAAIAALPVLSGSGTTWPPFQGDDVPQNVDEPSRRWFSIGVPIAGKRIEALRSSSYGLLSVAPLVDDLLAHEHLVTDGYIWARFQAVGNVALSFHGLDLIAGEGRLNFSQWKRLCAGAGITPQPGAEQCIQVLLAWLLDEPPATKAVEVPALRRVEQDVSEDFGGGELIGRLHKLKNPSASLPANRRAGDRSRFVAIQNFVRRLMGDSEATLEIPNELETLILLHEGKDLPLERLGTGIDEIIMIAVAATVNEGRVLCIEEPELHLHPLLQRQLLQYLIDETDNQYFVSTHSAHLLNATDGAVHRVSLEEGLSTLESVTDVRGRFRLVRDLGYQPSDILQANAVIWVEGPSDRVYVRHWLSQVDASLVEGLHYSIMFYGGGLLSNLTAKDDAEVNEFIDLTRINQNVAVVMDSDKEESKKHPNATKRRVRAEVSDRGGFAWITKGREIENYIPRQELVEAAVSVAPRATIPDDEDEFTDLFSGEGTIHKTNLARAIVRNGGAGLDGLDLRRRVDELVMFIRKANGLTSTDG